MDTSNPSTSMEENPTPEYMQKHYQEALQRYTVYEGDSDEYDSEEEQKVIEELKPEERADYDEYREVFVKQLVHYGRTMPVADEIRRHMFQWLPAVPVDYCKVASEATHRLRAEKQATRDRRAEARKMNMIKQIAPEDPEVMFIKFQPGIGPIVPTLPAIKTEPMDTTYPTSGSAPPAPQVPQPQKPAIQSIALEPDGEEDEDEPGDDTTIDAMIPEAINRDQVITALKKLGTASHQQALAYEDLQKAVPVLKDEELREVVSALPTPVCAHLTMASKDYLEREETQTVNNALAIGCYYLECHLHSRYPNKHEKPKKKAVAARFGIENRKFIELSQGVAYAGGSSK